jgi:hypothetical protein
MRRAEEAVLRKEMIAEKVDDRLPILDEKRRLHRCQDA